MNITVAKTIHNMRKIRHSLKGNVGFVPTMGYLHDGHISLVKLAQEENDHVIVSIFVNQKQFGSNKDFQRYPRDTERDLDLLEKTKTDVVFLPEAEELYPAGYETYVSLGEITKKLEGAIRPGHFTGVVTVLSKLFNIIEPTKAYFGQKDAQQVIVVKKMVADLNIPIDIIVGETLREPDGLAMSSRSVFLNDSERKEAAVIYQSLCLAKELFAKEENNAGKIKSEMKNLIHGTKGVIDYISIANPQTFEETTIIENGALISISVRFGKTRLIDNIFLKK